MAASELKKVSRCRVSLTVGLRIASRSISCALCSVGQYRISMLFLPILILIHILKGTPDERNVFILDLSSFSSGERGASSWIFIVIGFS